MKYQKGFAPLVIILLIVLGVGVVGGGYVFYKDRVQQKKFTPQIQDLQNPTADHTPSNNTPDNKFVSSYMGVHYPPYPNGTEFFSGLGSNDKFYDTHSVAQVSTPKGSEVWLSRIESRDSKGIPNLVVTDSLQAPDWKTNQFITIGYCGKLSSDSKILHDPLIAALANRQIYEDPQTHQKVYRDQAVRAWKINPATEKFEAYSSDGIFCDTTDAPPGYSG